MAIPQKYPYFVPIEANSLQQSVKIYSKVVKNLEKIIDEVVAELGLLG